MFVHGVVLQCVCVCLQKVSICQGNITANKLRDCFALSKHPGWKNWTGKSINQESCVTSFFFVLLMTQEVFNHAFFPVFGATALRTTKMATLVAHICHSITACLYFFAIHYFTACMSNQPHWCCPGCTTVFTATNKLLLEAVGFNLALLVVF